MAIVGFSWLIYILKKVIFRAEAVGRMKGFEAFLRQSASQIFLTPPVDARTR